MEDVSQKLAQGLRQHFPNEVRKAQELITRHPDTLWALPLFTTLSFTLKALGDAREKRAAGTVVNTLGAVFSLISAASGLKVSEVIKRRPQKIEISDDIKQRILKAIDEARASGRI